MIPKTYQEEVADMIRMFSSASKEARARLISMGAAVPVAAGSDPTRIKWAYRCKQCNSPALLFVGEQFYDAGGNIVDGVPPGLHTDKIPWIQDIPPEQVNRSHPKCQRCGHEVSLDYRCFRPSLIIKYDDFIASRQAGERLAAEHAAKKAQERANGTAFDSGQLSDRFRPNPPKPSSFLTDEQKDNIKTLEGANLLPAGMFRL